MLIDRTDTFIESLGLESYRVGGSVRDQILGRKAKDADYMIRGIDLIPLGVKLSEAVKDFERGAISALTLRDGRQGGWRVSGRGLGLIEIMLPRREAPRALTPEEQIQGGGVRRAFDIVVDPTIPLHEDAKRRDFTFNALYLSVPGGPIADPTARGLYDLQHKLIQTTYRDSFRDDPLRTLRALRFVSVLGYDLTAETVEQMREYAPAVTGLSAKGYASGTVIDEFSKLLMGDQPAKALRLARDTGVLAQVMPELAPMLGFDQGSRYHDLTTCEHTFKALETAAHVDAPLRVRWALLFHDSGKPETAWVGDDGRKHYYAKGDSEDHEVVGERIWRAAADRLGASKELRDDVALLIREHMVPVKTKNPGTRARRMRVRFGDAMTRDLLMHRTCDLSGKGVKVALNHIEHVAKLEKLRQEAEAAKVPTGRQHLALNGHDVARLGVKGRRIGEILDRILDEVVCQPDEQKLDREWQMQRAEALA